NNFGRCFFDRFLLLWFGCRFLVITFIRVIFMLLTFVLLLPFFALILIMPFSAWPIFRSLIIGICLRLIGFILVLLIIVGLFIFNRPFWCKLFIQFHNCFDCNRRHVFFYINI